MIPFRFAAQAKVLGIGRSRSVLLWDTDRNQPIREIALHGGAPISIALSADGQRLAVGYTDNSFTLYDCRTGQQEGDAIPAHVAGVEILCFSPDGRTLATWSARSVKLWNLAARREVAAFERPGAAISMGFTTNGNTLVLKTSGRIHVWRAPALEDIAVDGAPGSPR